MVKPLPSKQDTWVRFPPRAPAHRIAAERILPRCVATAGHLFFQKSSRSVGMSNPATEAQHFIVANLPQHTMTLRAGEGRRLSWIFFVFNRRHIKLREFQVIFQAGCRSRLLGSESGPGSKTHQHRRDFRGCKAMVRFYIFHGVAGHGRANSIFRVLDDSDSALLVDGSQARTAVIERA